MCAIDVTVRAKKIKVDKKESSERYTAAPTDASGLQIEAETTEQTRETFYSDDFDDHQEPYLNMEELHGDTINGKC